MNEKNEIAIIPTCVPHSAEDLRKEVEKIRSFSSMIHIDVDDGLFTPRLSWPYREKGRRGEFDFLPYRDVVYEAHLMVSDAREIGENFINAGGTSLVAHIESFPDRDMMRESFALWRDAGAREIGLAVLLGTSLHDLDTSVPFCDFIQVLSVAKIGAQGVPYDPRAVGHVRAIHERYPGVCIGVDCGVCATNIKELVEAGATRFAVGSAIMHAPDPESAYAYIRSVAESALQ